MTSYQHCPVECSRRSVPQWRTRDTTNCHWCPWNDKPRCAS